MILNGYMKRNLLDERESHIAKVMATVKIPEAICLFCGRRMFHNIDQPTQNFYAEDELIIRFYCKRWWFPFAHHKYWMRHNGGKWHYVFQGYEGL